MLKTKNGLPRYCCWNFDRHGGKRVRFRKNGVSTYLTGTPWSEEFMKQYARALDGTKAIANEAGSVRTTPGSLNALCVSYYKSPDFANLKPSTQAMRRNIIEKFREAHGTKPLRGLTRTHVQAIYDSRASTPEAANNLLKMLRVILNYGLYLGLIDANPAVAVKKYRSRSEGFHSWSEAEITKFQKRHPTGTRARLALALLLHTAQRRSDVVRMGWQHVKNDAITVKQEKTGTSLTIPFHPELKAALASVPRTNLTFLMTERGAPFSATGFGNWFKDMCNAAGLPRCTAHGLRKAAATRLADAGCSGSQIAAFTGHRSLNEVAHYTRAADQQRLARQAMDTQLRAEEEQNLSNPQTRLDKNAK
jgi:integrase